VSPPRFLADTSALVRIFRDQTVRAQWAPQVTAGTVASCPIVELELLFTARSKTDRDELVHLLRTTFFWIDMPYRAFQRATEIQAALTDLGTHRSAGAVDLLVAATAELNGFTLLHYHRDFDQIVRATGQPAQWIMPPGQVP
jgi:predicted nucleic acid-binding protein